MKKILPLALALVIATGAAAAWAEESREHVCFSTLDTNQDGVVTVEEFTAHYGSDPERFETADANNDGQLTHDEYHAILGHGAS